MYSALFRLLPGPTWAKIVQVLILIAAVIIVLFTWVFPWVADNLPITDNTVG
ncbi:hypothetical protein [Flaviflexus huanghaiensis]|uniref:hypothetical protein n=1 Tax=Flaviflexus huanghaiensis TaxID=1111473 RepID=UPI0015F81070|nr:hypothetical protein [Flaviflexus huanghaiensis]